VVGDVERVQARPAAAGLDRCDDFFPRRRVPVENADGAALLAEPARDRGADAVGAAGDEDGAILQTAHQRAMKLDHLSVVMPELVAGIHVLLWRSNEDVDGRAKPGHDAGEVVRYVRN